MGTNRDPRIADARAALDAARDILGRALGEAALAARAAHEADERALGAAVAVGAARTALLALLDEASALARR